jgi:GNAT superfamily N-acetyltransferase
MSVAVRALALEDEVRWRDLFQQYIVFYKANVAPDIIDLTWQRLINGADGMAGLVAEVPGIGVAGIAVCVFHRSSWSATWYCYLEDLFVDPASRGQGVGRALIEGVYDLSDARGATRTYWVTAENNETARALYDQHATRTPDVQYRR